MSVPPGYHGQYLRVDSRADRTRFVPLDEQVLRSFLGGVGLGSWILAQETESNLDPLGAESTIVFAFSPLVGTPLTTSAKFAVVAISPLTGRVCDALSSSHFAIAAKRTGVDAIAISGAWDEPVTILVDGNEPGPARVRVQPAHSLWGLSARDAEARLRAEFGNDWQIAAIGPAGEARIPFATISHDGRHAGRGGLGAVLGSKNVKAIAVRGTQRAQVADVAKTVQLARSLSSRSFGPATEKYRELGTVANLLVFNRFDALPTRNFQAGTFEGVERLASEDLAPARRIARNSCAACTIGCEHVYERRDQKSGVRMEYESLFALGPLCGINDSAVVLEAASLCDDLGLDTISTGGTIAFLMECAERGWIDADAIRFGDGDRFLETIRSIPDRRGIGALAALGSRRAAETIGREAPRIAMHVKGLEMPGYDPRSLQTMALGLAVGTRGADHNRSGAYEADFSGAVDRRHGDERSVLQAIDSEDRSALMDSLILCKFLRGVFHDVYAEWSELLRAVTGWDVDADELKLAATRIVNVRKCLNERAGWTCEEDTLPPRIFDSSPETLETALPKSRLDSMIASYYRHRGWCEDGTVPVVLRAKLGLSEPAFG